MVEEREPASLVLTLIRWKILGKTQSEATGRQSMGRSKEQRRRATFQAIWREPKVVIIYVHDSQGRRNKEYRVTIDGTLGDVDDMTEIVAMHLHRLGAASAASICFNSDGAIWIWDRIATILSLAKIPASVMIHQVLDVYHACENLHKAVDELMPPTAERTATYRTLRSTLRDGNWTSVIDALESMISRQLEADDSHANQLKETRRVIEYLRSHGERGHLNYSTFRVMGLPLGSGSIESAIRRVVNLRMKGNGIFWKEQRAEEMLMLRATILSDRWDENRLRAKRALQTNGKLSLPAYLSPKSDAQPTTSKKPIKSCIKPRRKDGCSLALVYYSLRSLGLENRATMKPSDYEPSDYSGSAVPAFMWAAVPGNFSCH